MFAWFKSLFKSPAAPASPAPRQGEGWALVGPKALDLILEFEGLDQPWLRPPGGSGITIGHGFDLGYCSREELVNAWQRHLSKDDLARLLRVVGKKGAAAEAVESSMKEVSRITPAAAREVFDRCTLPKWRQTTDRTFPGLHVLTPDQQGVLVSLVFNRGPALAGERRREMNAIATTLRGQGTPAQKARTIAALLRSMQRLWPTIPGLQRRRRFEAALMESEA